MASSPLQQAITNWNQRSKQAVKLGVPTSSWQQLASHDLNNVMQGGTPMPDQEVNVALASQAYGSPVIADPKPRHGLGALVGNAAQDVGGLITGFIPGAASYLHHLPSEVMGTAPHAPYEPSSFSPQGLLAATRNVAKNPLFAPLPLVHTAANLTTPAGRTQLSEHPVGATLDVLPLLSSAGAVAGGLATGGEAAQAGSALEALQEGRLARAGMRGVTDLAGKITGTTPRAAIAQTFENLGASPAIRESIMRPYNVLARKTQREAVGFYRREIEPSMGKLSKEESQQLYHEAANFDPTTKMARNPDGTTTPIPADHLAILDKVQELNDKFKKYNVNRGDLFEVPYEDTAGNAKSAVYSADEPVVKQYKSFAWATDRVQSAMDNVRKLTEKVADRESKLATRTGKLRKFYERPEDFAARPEGPVGFDTVAEAINPFVESFRHLDPRVVYQEIISKIANGEVRRQVTNQLSKDLRVLEGDGGLVAKLQDSVAARDLRGSQKAATEIARVFRHKGWDQFSTSQTLRSFMGDVRDELIGLSGKERSHGYAARQLTTAQRDLEGATAKLTKNQSLAEARHLRFLNTLTSTPPAAFHPHITELIREGSVSAARDLYHGQELEHAITVLRESPSTAAMESLVGEDTFKGIMQSAIKSWRDLSAAGLDPIWLHHVDPGQYESFMYAKPLPTKFLNPSQVEARVFNFGPHMEDIAASVTSAGVELIRQAATEEFINKWVMKFARQTQQLHGEYMDTFAGNKRVATETLSGLGKRMMEKEWESFNPADYGVRPTARVTNPDALSIPKGVGRSLRMMMKDYKLPLTGPYDAALKVYKLSVLTGPRHMVHVGVGGMTMAMLREPGTIAHVLEAARMVRDGTAPIDLMQPLYDLPTDSVFHLAAGKTMARHYVEAIGSVPKALGRFEEFMGSVERTATMLSAEARGLDREVAMRQALKVYIDMDGMSAMERTVIRNVFPFYAFTKHIFRYLFTYPVDHPIRAAMLSRFAEQEQADWDTGLPRKYQQLLFLGQPDAKGNVQTIEYKSVNPFRSIANDFTLAGFISSLNPLLTAGMSAAGMNTISAVPELYPKTSYDTTSGSITAKRSDVVPKIVSSFIPEFGALDHFVQLTSDMKRLKATSPDAYRRQLFSNLNLTFYPGKVNVPYEQEHTEINRFQAAQQAASQAVKTGQLGDAARYNLLPFQGVLQTPDQIAAQVNAIKQSLVAAGMGNVSPKAVMRPVNKGARTKSTSVRSFRPRNPGK